MTETIRLPVGFWPPPAYNANTYKCELLTNAAAFTNRDGARVEYFNGAYWMLGGWWPESPPDGPNGWSLTNRVTNQVWSSADLINWTLELAHDDNPPVMGAGARWKPVHAMMSWVYGGLLWVAGGDDSDSGQDPPGTVRSDVWNSPDGVTWTRVAASSAWGAGKGLWNPIPGTFDGYMHILGGQREGFPGQPLNDWSACAEHWRSTDGIGWERLLDMPFTVARMYKAPVTDGKMFLIGGGTGEIVGGVTYSSTWAYDGVYWRSMSSNSASMWTSREWIGVEEYDGKLWATTGVHREDASNQTGGWFSRDLGRTWERINWLWEASHADALVTGPSGLALLTGRQQGINVFLVSPS